MRKTRLLMVLILLTALCALTAVPVSRADVPVDYCWQFSNEDCVYYYYNSATGCCEGLRNRPGVMICPDVCE
jgi:hypothetical protein